MRGAASLPVRVAVLRLPLIVSAGETIVIATIYSGGAARAARVATDKARVPAAMVITFFKGPSC